MVVGGADRHTVDYAAAVLNLFDYLVGNSFQVRLIVRVPEGCHIQAVHLLGKFQPRQSIKRDVPLRRGNEEVAPAPRTDGLVVDDAGDFQLASLPGWQLHLQRAAHPHWQIAGLVFVNRELSVLRRPCAIHKNDPVDLLVRNIRAGPDVQRLPGAFSSPVAQRILPYAFCLPDTFDFGDRVHQILIEGADH